MSGSGHNEVWTPPRLRARLVEEKGLAPAPACYIIWRATTRANGAEIQGYQVPGDRERRDEAAFERWLLERNLAAVERLSVSVLVIREQLDANGMVREGILERRRGGVDGPYYGNVARVEFSGAAKLVRRFRAGPDGRLTELPAEDATGVLPPDDGGDVEGFAGEDAAVHEFLGPGSTIIDRRAPTLFEDLVGLSAIIHARRTGGAVIGCGVGWHGDTAFVLAADFPRHGPLAPSPDFEAAVERALKSRDLVRCETRVDEHGPCVIAREKGGWNLFTIRLDGNATRIDPYTPGRGAAGNDDQRRWMTYAETYEARTILDAWRNGRTDELAVLTIDPDLKAWRHIIDTDGVEISRQTDNEAAAAAVYREQVGVTEPPSPRNGPPEEREISSTTIAPEADAPSDSLLIKAVAWSKTMTLLAQIRADVGAGHAAQTVAERLSALTPTLTTLNVPFSASLLRRLIERVEWGALPANGVAAALDEAMTCLREEAALTRIAVLTSAKNAYQAESPFGPLIDLHIPAAVYDIEEAVRCLALRRSTACVLHAMQVMRPGLASLERILGISGLTELSWSDMIAAVRDAAHGDLAHALVRVRQAWRAPGLLPAAKYTEEEAETVLIAVEGFMRLVAARLEALDETSVG